MKKFSINPIVLACMLLPAVPAFSQSELFEQDVSGIHPYAGLKWNSKISEPLLGFEYTLDGQLTFGIEGGLPLKDTTFSSPATDTLIASKFHSFFFNPYFQVELLNPDYLHRLSFSVRGDFVYRKTLSDAHGNTLFTSGFGIGPILAYRFKAGDQTDIIPKVSYEFMYARWKRDWQTYDNGPGNPPGHFDDQYFLQHNIAVALNFVYWFTETQGLNAEPKAYFEFGDGVRRSDWINAGGQIGYLLAF